MGPAASPRRAASAAHSEGTARSKGPVTVSTWLVALASLVGAVVGIALFASAQHVSDSSLARTPPGLFAWRYR